MRIVGLEELVFGVENIAACAQYLTDYGCLAVDVGADGGRFEAEDGTGVVLRRATDSSLPAAPTRDCLLRKTVMGVADAAALEQIGAELSRDRKVETLADGSLQTVDDLGFALGFRITRRRPFERLGEISNAPGSPLQRAVNQLGVAPLAGPVRPRTLSHVVYFVPDVARAEAFYTQRLGFRVTDRFTDVGPFLQPAGSLDHHTHFLLPAPPHMQGVEHFTFHFGGPTEVLRNGWQFVAKGYQPFWGPGRHLLGSNWFWYFNSPFACHVEMDADMDLHDASWTPRSVPLTADNSQAFLLRYRTKWIPGPGVPEAGAYA